jgi:uncharacterized protein (TIGR02246 family)
VNYCRFFIALWSASVILLGSALHSRADERGQPATMSRDEAEVRRAAAEYREAADKGDLDAMVSFWADDADYVDQAGRAYKIKEGLEHAKQLSRGTERAPHAPLQTKILSIRFVTPDVAIEDGMFERTRAAAGQSAEGQYAAVWVKRDGTWLINSLRESPLPAAGATDHLKGLSWMVGDWVAEGSDATAEVSCTWGPDSSYLLREIKMQPKGDKPVSVTQWIGWDPTHKRIRSFAFDSRGGYSDGVWTNEGDAWVVTTTGVLPDGRRTSATNLYTPVDDNTAIWESVDDEVDGRPGADIRLRASRKQAAK